MLKLSTAKYGVIRSSVVSLILLLIHAGCSDNNIDLNKTKDTTHQIDSLNNLITEQQNYDLKNLQQVDSLFKFSLALGYDKGIAESAANYIRLLTIDYQYTKAMAFYFDNISRFEEIKDPYLQVLMYEQIGILYMELEDFDKAYYFFNEVLLYYQKNKNFKKLSFVYSRIGLMFKTNDNQKAIEYLQKSLDISYEINDSVGIARDLHNVGLIFKEKQIYDTAINYYEQALLINEKIKNWDYYAINLLNLASVEKQNKNYDNALKIFNQLTIAFDSLNDKNNYAKVLLHIGDSYLQLENYDKAIQFFNSADSIGKNYSLTNILRNSNWGLYTCFNKLGNYSLALKYRDAQYEFENNLRNKRNYQELTRLELQFKNEQLNKQRMWDQQKQKFLLYFALVVVLIFAAFVFQLFRKQKFKVAKEKLERKVLQNELEGKERELTSFVLNMIRLNEKKMSIINYLKLQKPRLKKENHDVIDTAIRDLEYDQDAGVWEEFEMRFNKVNSEFYQKLADRFPDLTNNEKRLCAFLIMNMNTKDISSITGQSVDAIGKARTRLRKKLGITNQDESITTVLTSL